MATDDEPFIAAIRAAPDDDLPRLAYADFLEEIGRPERAEFIRLQILGGPNSEGWQKKLLKRHQAEWVGPAADLATSHGRANDDRWGLAWRRGFVEAVESPMPLILRHGRTLLDCCPLVRDVTLFEVSAELMPDFARSPLLEWLGAIRVADWLTPEAARGLARIKGARACKLLHLMTRYPRFENAFETDRWVFESLAWGKHWQHLEELKVSQLAGVTHGREATDEAVRWLDGLQRRLNGQIGRRVVTVHRPFEEPFPVDLGDQEYHHPLRCQFTGHDSAGRRLLATFVEGNEEEFRVLVFDDAGQLTEVHDPGRVHTDVDMEDAQLALLETWGFTQGRIHIQEFWSPEARLALSRFGGDAYRSRPEGPVSAPNLLTAQVNWQSLTDPVFTDMFLLDPSGSYPVDTYTLWWHDGHHSS